MKTWKRKEYNVVKFDVDGTEYSFSKDSVDGEPVIVARYVENGEGFAIWTRDVVSLPESAEEAEEYIKSLDWAVEQSSALDSNRDVSGLTAGKVEKLLSDMGYDVFHLEYNDGDSEGRFQTEDNGEYINFVVWTEDEIEIV